MLAFFAVIFGYIIHRLGGWEMVMWSTLLAYIYFSK